MTTIEQLQAEIARLTASLDRQCELNQNALNRLHEYEYQIENLQRQVEIYRRAAFAPREAMED